MGEQWGRGCHVDNIGIALKASHESSFENGCLIVVPFLAFSMTGIFSCKYFWTLSVVGVIAQSMGEKPFFVAIVMLIDQICLLSLHGFPTVFKAIGVVWFVFWHRSAGSDNLNVGIFGADSSNKRFQSLIVELAPLLVAHSDKFHIERSGVSHFSTDLSPLAVSGTIGKLDEVKTVVDIRLQLINGLMSTLIVPVLILAGHTDVEDRQRFGTDILGELEELVET